MTANTNTNTASQRLEYLAAMGIDCWQPRVQLPGALQARVYARAITREKPAQEPNRSTSQPTETQKPAPGPRRTAADILSKAAISTASAAEQVRSAPPREAATPKTSMALNEAQLSLQLLECRGHCLIIDDAHNSREQQALLQNLMFALSGEPPGSYRATPFDWASIPPQGGDAVDVLRGIVDRAVSQHSIRAIILMGEAAKILFECDASATGPVLAPAWLSKGAQLVATHSSADLLLEPGRKADTWLHTQAAVGQAAH